MDRWAYRRRRIAVLVVAIVAGAATIATSPAHAEANVDASTAAKVVLSGEEPRAVGRFVLTLSSGTLPLGTSVGPSPTGTVSFVVSGPGGTGAGGNGPVQVTATAVGIETPALADPAGPSWPIEQLCRVAEPCRREFDVSVEWLQPRPGSSIDVPITAKVAIRYNNWESPPPGATAAWEAGEFAAAAPPPAVPASIDLGRTTLGRDSPLAARHVVLRGSAALLADPTTTEITAYVRSEGTEQRSDVLLTLVADDASDQTPADAGTFIQPFTGCPRAEECARGFTVVARWIGTAPDGTVDVDWSFDAIARFVDSAAIPSDATMTGEVDRRLDLGSDSPRLQGHAEGSFDLVSTGGRKSGRVRLVVTPPPPTGNAYFGAAPPAVAMVRLRAALKDPSEAADLSLWVSTPNQPSGMPLALADDGTELQVIAIPLPRCFNPPNATCPGSIEIVVDSRTDRDATISWDVSVDLPLPSAGTASGQLTVEVADAP